MFYLFQVEEHMVGKAFGLSYSLYDGVIFLTPLMYGHTYDSTGDETLGLCIFALLSTIGSALCVPLWIYDKKYFDSVLTKPSPGGVTLGQLFSCIKSRGRKDV